MLMEKHRLLHGNDILGLVSAKNISFFRKLMPTCTYTRNGQKFTSVLFPRMKNIILLGVQLYQ